MNGPGPDDEPAPGRSQFLVRKTKTEPTARPGPGSGLAPPGMAPPPRIPSRREITTGTVLAVVATLALMLATEPQPGDRLGRGLHARPRGPASGPGSGPCADPARFAATWRPPPSSWSRPTARRPPQPAEIDTRAELVRPARARLVLAVRPRGAARPPARSTRSSAWSGDLLAPAGQTCRAPGSGRSSPSACGAGPSSASSPGGAASGRRPLAAGAWVFQPQPLRPRALRHL